jgi:hypothetical protein
MGYFNDDNISIGVSIEGGTFFYWTNTSSNNIAYFEPTEYKNQWVHFAISRSNGVTKVFMNGNSIGSMDDTNDFNGVNDLIISNESTRSNDAAFGGYIYYFSWVKGVPLYTTNFTVTNNYPSLTNDYVLLLTASNFDGSLGNTVENNNVSTIQNTPSNFISNNINNTSNQPTLKKPLFSNNSLVFYNKGSLASCGVGSVRNSSVKSRRI